MTRDNETRARALTIVETPADDLDAVEYETLTSERHWFVGLSKTLGIPTAILGELMSSREYTEYLAAGIVDVARQDVMHELMKKARR